MEATSRSSTQEVEVMLTATCASASGKSTLTFDVGRIGSEFQLRISGNTATGAFTREWVPMRAIRERLDAVTPGHVTSAHLRALFAGKSINTPGFLLAVLLREGLVRPSTVKRRCYESTDELAFAAVTAAWEAGSTSSVDLGNGTKSGAKRGGGAKEARQAKATKATLSRAAQDGAVEATRDGPAAATRNGALDAAQAVAGNLTEDSAHASCMPSRRSPTSSRHYRERTARAASGRSERANRAERRPPEPVSGGRRSAPSRK